MLVLTRKVDERIQIGDDITVVILQVQSHRVKLGIEAPREVLIMRGELLPHDSEATRAATEAR